MLKANRNRRKGITWKPFFIARIGQDAMAQDTGLAMKKEGSGNHRKKYNAYGHAKGQTDTTGTGVQT